MLGVFAFAVALFGFGAITASPAFAATDHPAAWYVTLAGDADDPSGHANNIHSYDASGHLVAKAVLATGAGDPPLAELRGMLLAADGSLYVANATKSDSAVLHFEQAATPSAPLNPVPPAGVFAAGAPANPGLDHPYGLADGATGELLVSSQDSADVTVFDAEGMPVPAVGASTWWADHYPAVSFAAGTLVPSTTDVPAKDGGLTAPRGIVTVPADSQGEDPTLYVADNAEQAVRSYDAVTGEFLGDVLTPKTGGIGNPVALMVNGDELYVSSEGTDNVVSLSLSTGKTHEVVPKKLGTAVLDHPSGIAFGSDGQLYVASRVGEQILAYTLDDKRTRATSGSVFIDQLPDQPEQLLSLPEQTSATAPPATPTSTAIVPAVTESTNEPTGAANARTPAAPSSSQLAATGTPPMAWWWPAAALLGGLALLGVAQRRTTRHRPRSDNRPGVAEPEHRAHRRIRGFRRRLDLSSRVPSAFRGDAGLAPLAPRLRNCRRAARPRQWSLTLSYPKDARAQPRLRLLDRPARGRARRTIR
ncbi:hypothetical protein LQ955_14275 [Subtercola endophyticus]|nr:hypothetical protein [Subtercola endophyticus]UFS58174.1 hypothetical protein LQ955_14275 [Subtercola endophyticus]